MSEIGVKKVCFKVPLSHREQGMSRKDLALQLNVHLPTRPQCIPYPSGSKIPTCLQTLAALSFTHLG